MSNILRRISRRRPQVEDIYRAVDTPNGDLLRAYFGEAAWRACLDEGGGDLDVLGASLTDVMTIWNMCVLIELGADGSAELASVRERIVDMNPRLVAHYADRKLRLFASEQRLFAGFKLQRAAGGDIEVHASATFFNQSPPPDAVTAPLYLPRRPQGPKDRNREKRQRRRK
jgi:hypothetical protein